MIDIAPEGEDPRVVERRLERLRAWETFIASHRVGDIVSGVVTRAIRGGYLLDIGFPVFLPASQLADHDQREHSALIGLHLTCAVKVIDVDRMNIVLTRRGMVDSSKPRPI